MFYTILYTILWTTIVLSLGYCGVVEYLESTVTGYERKSVFVCVATVITIVCFVLWIALVLVQYYCEGA